MEKLKMHSSDHVEGNLDKLAELFPGCVTEARDEATGKVVRAVDFDQLRQEVSGRVVEGPRERFELNWTGKREATVVAYAPIARTLRPRQDQSISFGVTRNLIIEGDNLEALKLMSEAYLSKIHLIYIDPPYNTGNDFIYDDDFTLTSEEYRSRSLQIDSSANRMITLSESAGRYHSTWLSMMYSRLKRAHALLRDDGVFMVSIDDHESHTLRLMCEEIFGRSNFIITLIWEKGRKNDSTFFSETVEYIHVFAKDKTALTRLGKWREKKPGIEKVIAAYDSFRALGLDHHAIEDKMRDFYEGLDASDPARKLRHFWHSDARGLFFGADISSASTSIPDYEVLHPTTGKPCKKPSRGWGCNPDEMERRIAQDRVLFGEDESTIPLKKSYLTEVDSIVKTPVFYKDGRAATGVLKNLVGTGVFENPKDHEVLADLFRYVAPKDALILDFFAGSGSTAHAAMTLNAEDGGSRRFILIQIPTECKSGTRALQAGYPTITDITRRRVAAAGEQLLVNSGSLLCKPDVGFRWLTLDTSNMSDVYYAPDNMQQAQLSLTADNIKLDRSSEDLLFQVLLDWGIDLTLSIESRQIAGRLVFLIDGNALAACFETGIDEALVRELAKLRPLRAVFRDGGYASDSTKINVEQIFKLLSPETEVRSL